MTWQRSTVHIPRSTALTTSARKTQFPGARCANLRYLCTLWQARSPLVSAISVLLRKLKGIARKPGWTQQLAGADEASVGMLQSHNPNLYSTSPTRYTPDPNRSPKLGILFLFHNSGSGARWRFGTARVASALGRKHLFSLTRRQSRV